MTFQLIQFFNAQPLSGGALSTLGSPEIQVTNVCAANCTGIFTQRDVAIDPVPQAAIYNNRISNRFDTLFDATNSNNNNNLNRKRRFSLVF